MPTGHPGGKVYFKLCIVGSLLPPQSEVELESSLKVSAVENNVGISVS